MKKENAPHFVKRNLQVAGSEYLLLLQALKERYRQAQVKASVKVNTYLLEYYWSMGQDIARLRAEVKWGSAFYECLSLDLKAEFPAQNGFSVTNLKYVKRWYEFYNQENIIRHQVGDELEMPYEFGLVPWRHHVQIFTHCSSVKEACFYIDKVIEGNWSRKELEDFIADDLYGKSGHAISNFSSKLPLPQGKLAEEMLKDPYNFEFAVVQKGYDELDLEKALLSDISRFLLELGQGFAFVGRQMELRMPDGRTYVPDMIFYHIKLKCYVVMELKTVDFEPEFAGKLNFYVTAVDHLMKGDDDNPTIGLLVCKSKNKTIVEWSFQNIHAPLSVASYAPPTTLLPSAKDLEKMIDNTLKSH